MDPYVGLFMMLVSMGKCSLAPDVRTGDMTISSFVCSVVTKPAPVGQMAPPRRERQG